MNNFRQHLEKQEFQELLDAYQATILHAEMTKFSDIKKTLYNKASIIRDEIAKRINLK